MEPTDEDVVMWGLNRTAASPPTAAHHSFSNNASFSLAGLGLSSLSLSSGAGGTSTLRRNSIFGFDERIVLDIGSRLLKVGLSGEEQPRCVLPIFVASIDSPSTNAGLYEPGLDSRLMARRRRVLTDMLRMVYTRLVLTDPKQRKVVICDKVLMPMAIKQMVIEILFDVFETPALNFVSSDMLSLMCTGKSSGMVVDIGYLEATAVPIFDGRPMPHLTQTSSLGTHALISRLKLLIRNHATQHSPNPTPASPTTLDTMISAQPEEFWTDLAARICFAAPTNSRAQMTVTAQNNSLGPYAVYESKATDVHVRFARDSKNNADENQDSHDAIVLRIPGWVRERAAEVWFEGSGAIPGDDDSLVSVILSTLIKVPIDSRAAVARNIVFVGGGAMFCGIPERCEADLRSFGGDNGEFVISGGRGGAGKRGGGGGGGRMYRFDEVRRLVREKIAVARPVFPANILAWVGGSLAGSLKMTQKELRRDEYVALREAERAQCVPDWGRLAPPEDADTNEAAAEDSEK